MSDEQSILIGGRRVTLGESRDIDLDEEEVYDQAGNRLTEATAARLAEDAVRQARGRRSLTAPGRHSPRVSFRVPAELRQRAERRAAAEHKSLSALAREAFEAYLVTG